MRFMSSLGSLALALSLATSASAAEPAKAPAAAPIKAQPAPAAAKAAVKPKTVNASQLKPGTVIKAGRESGYGNRIEIQHPNGYVTTYNHMSGFARGMSEGARVRQGQVVGFLGMTGLATGPHLHYEVIVNGHFVDPLRVRLARTRELDNRMLTSFKKERDRIDGLIAKAPNAQRVASRTGSGIQR